MAAIKNLNLLVFSILLGYVVYSALSYPVRDYYFYTVSQEESQLERVGFILSCLSASVSITAYLLLGANIRKTEKQGVAAVAPSNYDLLMIFFTAFCALYSMSYFSELAPFFLMAVFVFFSVSRGMIWRGVAVMTILMDSFSITTAAFIILIRLYAYHEAFLLNLIFTVGFFACLWTIASMLSNLKTVRAANIPKQAFYIGVIILMLPLVPIMISWGPVCVFSLCDPDFSELNLVSNGFQKLKPVNYLTEFYPNGSGKITFINGVGKGITVLDVRVEDLLDKRYSCSIIDKSSEALWAAGDNMVITVPENCIHPAPTGDRFRANVSLYYKVSFGSQAFTPIETGELNGVIS